MLKKDRKNYLSIAMAEEANPPTPILESHLPTNFFLDEHLHRKEMKVHNNYGLRQGPNGYNNWAGNTPIQELG